MVDCSSLPIGTDKTAAPATARDNSCLVNLADPETSAAKNPAGKKPERTIADRFSITSGFESLHFGPRPGDPQYKLNDNNWGLGGHYELNDRIGFSGGYYRSSTRTNNTYATIDYDYLKRDKFSFGLSAGLVTGYQDLHGKPTPLLLPTATQHLGKDFFVRELVIPPLHNVTPAVFSVQFGFYPARLFGHQHHDQ